LNNFYPLIGLKDTYTSNTFETLTNSYPECTFNDKIMFLGYRMSNRYIIAVKIMFLLLLMACNKNQNIYKGAFDAIDYAERNGMEMTQEDWDYVDTAMLELEDAISNDRASFTEEEIREARKLQGRYAALVVKKGVGDLQDVVKDLGNQIDGFIEGFKDTTKN
jgi:hypothetical protein